MFFINQSDEQKESYFLLLKIVGALSKLSSDNTEAPYLYYRMAENIFCKSFGAKNLSRSDISLDASKHNIGLGLKTFLHKNGNSLEKVAEFNKDRSLFTNKDPLEIIKKVSKLRNERLKSTSGICDIKLENMIYHCVTREKGKFLISEIPMNLINIENIGKVKEANNTIAFNDGLQEYSFNLSKNTLFQRFNLSPIQEIDINIFEDPYTILEKYLSKEFKDAKMSINPIVGTIYLPLYSEQKGINVPLRSGLNQWNANGRVRNYNEAYIPVPSLIHKKFPGFFPSNKDSFTLHLPNGSFVCAKLCQGGDKSIMSNPNSDLGKWLLRDILRLKEGELATYSKLEEIGIDSVEINKFEDNTYEINFKQIGTYQEFKENFLSAKP